MRDPILLRGHEEGGEIEEVGFGCGELEVRDEGVNKGESFLTGGFFGSGIGVE